MFALIVKTNAGSDAELRDFGEGYLAAMAHATVVARWYNDIPLRTKCRRRFVEQDDLILDLNPNVTLVDAAVLNPITFDDSPIDANASWFAALAGVRVLVVTSHASDVQSQYGRLPFWRGFPTTFAGLAVVEAPQTLGPAANVSTTWADQLDDLQHRVAAVAGQFDVALLACGAYGLPAADFIFSHLNRTAIYVGGALQLFFGIRGNRWDKQINNKILHSPNSSTEDRWICPSETPDYSNIIENHAYWCRPSPQDAL